MGSELSSDRHVTCSVSGETRDSWQYRCVWFAHSDAAPERGRPGSGRLIVRVNKSSGSIVVARAPTIAQRVTILYGVHDTRDDLPLVVAADAEPRSAPGYARGELSWHV